ncbi:YueI family protein [Aquibacillus rhizosphaerae]|uniref:YueI family protein n=1 Tax=Aquibacillus rhizosphaerae TaxID=3051431 RepID=A0ABT7L5M1_9BACI|nr:YueI family protein [Aquibacillus sp. LR5S19]MDL4841167.1 YueI family protein [Aquibacillus sp. LR5S19]
MKKDIDDYLQDGIYGTKEINPSERKVFLGSLRERIVLALTKGQVMKNNGVDQLEIAMKAYPEAKLLLNGNVSYRFFKPYKAAASKNNIPYTSVKNRNAKSNYGLVLTLEYAIDKEDIHLKEQEKNTKKIDKIKKRSLFDWLFNR